MSVTEFDTTARASTWREPRTLLACGTLALALALTACGGSAKPSQNKGPGSGGTPAATGNFDDDVVRGHVGLGGRRRVDRHQRGR